jgi:hypothetical protein
MANQRHILSTKPGHPATEIAGVRRLPADGKGGVLLESAAESMAELQDGDGKPLTGKALVEAAQEFAEMRGLRVESISNAKAEKLPQIMGAAADRPPAAEVAVEAHETLYGADAPSEDDHTEAEPTTAEPTQTTQPVPAADAA